MNTTALVKIYAKDKTSEQHYKLLHVIPDIKESTNNVT
jgi:hypothetical protein